MTLTSFMAQWVSGTAGRTCSPRWERDRRYWLRRIVELVGDVDLSSLTPALVWDAQASLRQAHLAASTVNHVTSTFLALVRDAEAMELLPEGSHARFRAKVHFDREVAAPIFGPWSLEEREQIIAAVDAPRFRKHRALVYWQFLTGMRLSEALGMTRADVDLEGRVAYVRRSRSKGMESVPKTRRSARAVPLPARLVVVMGYESWPSPDAPLFTSAEGQPVDEHNFANRTWRSLLQFAGVRHQAFRCTRHTYVSLAVEAGLSFADVGSIIGDNPATMEKHYQRQTKGVGMLDVERATGGAPGIHDAPRGRAGAGVTTPQRANLRLVRGGRQG